MTDPHSGSAPMLRVDRIAKTYGEGDAAVRAIDELTFDVAEKEILCIVGQSGAGKTTLLKCLAGLAPTTGGQVELEGEVVTEPPAKLALVFQEYGRSLMPWLTVEGNIMLPLRGKKMRKSKMRERAHEMLEAVGLAHTAKRYPWQLSGGMQQRVAIARALAYNPDVLLMDEPFASVDAQTRMELEDMMLPLRERFGITIVFVTHDIDEAIYLGDRVVVLSPAPTRVRQIVPIDLPGGRDQATTKTDPQFGQLHRTLLELIRGGEQPEHGRSEADVDDASARSASSCNSSSTDPMTWQPEQPPNGKGDDQHRPLLANDRIAPEPDRQAHGSVGRGQADGR